jgi:hypothetical protein
MRSVKALLKGLVPGPLYRRYVRFRVSRNRRRDAGVPLKELFGRIYRSQGWGGGAGDWCSGSGSSERHAEAYAALVKQFMHEHGIRTMVDLGCGDFVVGRRLVAPGLRYIGVDLVDELVERNRALHGGPGVEFVCLDITADPLPEADLCVVRQVLQHLSNEEIARVLGKLRQYRYVLVTEHYPAASVRIRPNLDKPHGGDTRIYDDSAVCLDQPPFAIRGISLLFEDDAVRDLMNPGEKIRTFLIQNEIRNEPHHG